MTGLAVWFAAIRPKTLSLSVAPVLAGTALAYADLGEVNWLTMVAALLVAMLIQVGTNLHNDQADFERGSDGPDRLGPPRATAQGWLTAASVRQAAAGCFLLSFALGIYLVVIGGWPILVLGVLSILAGWSYSGGPWPISYSPLGELFVLLFFGLLAVGGSYYLQALSLNKEALLTGAALGSLAAAVLVINNYRDRQADRVSGRRTLAVLFGGRFSQLEYMILLMLPFLLPGMLGTAGRPLWWTPYLLLPWALYLLYCMARAPGGEMLNLLLARTAQFQLLFTLGLGIGFLG